MQKVLVTGGAGFIGSNFITHMLALHDDVEIVNLDLLTYAGNTENLKAVADNPRYHFVHGDICDVTLVRHLFAQGISAVVNFAAESHVDRSIDDPGVFVRTNIGGTQVLLDTVRRYPGVRFLQISTDEVYGFLGSTGSFTEQSPIRPSSPYSASKASADLLALSYHHTFGLDVCITRCSNNYGPNQHWEKLIPRFISRAIKNQPLPLYGTGLNVRDWLYVDDHCDAIDSVLQTGRSGEVYNVGGNSERTNLEIARIILAQLGRPESLITLVADRPGHDWRYAIDATKLQTELGWRPRYNFATGIRETIEWYTLRPERWEPEAIRTPGTAEHVHS